MDRSGWLRLLAAGVVTAALGASLAQDPQPDPVAAVGEESPEARKAREKEERIAEYLRKQEEKRIARAEAQSAQELERLQAAEAAATAPAAAEPTAKSPKTKGSSALPKDLARAQGRVRQTSMAADPTVKALLDKIDARLASAYELAAFGNFISENGLHREALEYYKVAIHLMPNDPVLWVNIGTIHRKLQDVSGAMSAYAHALSIDPNYALAHYNIGAIHDDRGNYHDAIDSYKIALRLDPTLGDPAVNPQAATNENLMTVRLLLYEEEIGSSGLPLVDIATEAPPKVERK
jgi:tetratricopeptide (TPR) repeat protein